MSKEKLYAQIIEQVESNNLPWTKSWKVNALKPPVSFLSGKAYKGINIFTLFPTGEYFDPRWITFNKVRELGAKIKKGERSKIIKFWGFIEKKKSEDENSEDEIIKSEDENSEDKFICFAKYSRVWNVEQTEGIEVLTSDLDSLDLTWSNESIVESILENSKVQINHGGDVAFYDYQEDFINLPNKNRFSSAADYYAVAMHELAHATGHKSRLNRNLDVNDFAEYAKEELVAELTSFFLSLELGLPFDASRHIAYLDGWIKKIKENPENLIMACREAEKVKDYILSFSENEILSIEKAS